MLRIELPALLGDARLQVRNRLLELEQLAVDGEHLSDVCHGQTVQRNGCRVRICAVLVVLYALSVLFGIGAEAPPSGPRLSDFVVPALSLAFPVAVALVQLRRQTLLGWFLLLAGFAFAAVGLCYLTVNEQLFEPWLLTLLATSIAISVGLVLHRPTR